MQLINADSAVYLKTLKENSVDSVVCDPPYGISLLGNEWDKGLPPIEIWKECLRVLKPGGYILAMSAARLYHHLAIDMEKVGFITHPMIGWIYGSGFPKATDLAKELDKAKSELIPDDDFRNYLKKAVSKKGYSYAELEEHLGSRGMFSHYVGRSQPQYPTPKTWKQLKKLLDLDDRYDELINTNRMSERSDNGPQPKQMLASIRNNRAAFDYTPTTELGKKWFGYKYGLQCLKPALEPIYMGQKPFMKPIPTNVKRWDVGAMNIEACRIANLDRDEKLYNKGGRYPANVIHDGSIEVCDAINKSGGMSEYYNSLPFTDLDTFYYVSKPSSKERSEYNNHPTVKPIRLMAHLTKLVTPKGGTCLDPFLGSGTTAIAAMKNGFHFIGIEREKEYFEIAKDRVAECHQYLEQKSGDESLFEKAIQ